MLALIANTNDITVHPLDALGSIDTVLTWRRGHFSSALNALRDVLVKSANVEAGHAQAVAALE